MLDYVIIRQRDRQDVLLTRAMRGADCWTDHRLVRSFMSLHIRPPTRKRPAMKKLNCASLKTADGKTNLADAISHRMADAPALEEFDDCIEAGSHQNNAYNGLQMALLKKTANRAAATSEERLQRLESDRAHKAVKRAAETSEERLQHLESDRAHKAVKRAAETSEECLQHFESDRAHTASTRAAET
ncbi:hypothetical protein Pcinc_001616 [Petrolisthes cinctipes]|uniref:Uncharacterized protein n=1 Tax=Petrolisthes cinctipes TaxID=88211 RepID=A0AAE1L3R2_PETCI|nr:hypothetical protein Pcinc_001616 [Petrolisthes cinctipes]